MSKLKDEQGSGLVLTLMVLTVLAVLAAALATVTLGSYRLTANNRDSVSAYYIAEADLNEKYEVVESVVQTTYDMDTNQDTFYALIEQSFKELEGKNSDGYATQFGKSPFSNVTIKKVSSGNPRTYTLTSEGEVGDSKRTIAKDFTVGYIEKNQGGGLPALPKNAAAIVKNKIELTGSGKIIGDVHFDSLEAKSIVMNGDSSINEGFTFVKNIEKGNKLLDIPPKNTGFQEKNGPFLKQTNINIPWESYYEFIKTFPDVPVYDSLPDETISSSDGSNQHKFINQESFYYNSWIFNNKNFIFKVAGNSSFKEFKVDSDVPLKIDTMGKDITIVVDHLNLNRGSLELVGEGSVTFYVKSKFNLNSSGDSNLNKNGKTEQLKILYAGTDDFIMNGGIVNGSIFVKNAVVNVNSAHGINGLLISGGPKVTHNGGTSTKAIVIAPSADFDFSGSGSIEGAVIGKQVILSGAGEIKVGKPIVDLNIFNTSSKKQSDKPNFDLIKSDASIEK
ncbi:PilX N-terminal domain-containing pilus assembly protein [Marinilactibacillus sp. Marseille-P9653]|uniref:DUF7305 domain-containing protein n=1 Tax=Marinilactibacillus sp. Marseille-P9653 TaxID=2866583 RepID=UPI001CE49F4F|nr:PilX N-terminal domain-containing pilus assembly protein [Marinilactibacillus sp. Marseille-P9653]